MDPSGVLLPPPMSTFAPEVDRLFTLMVIVSGIVASAVIGTMVTFAVRYRRRPGRPARPTRRAGVIWWTWALMPFLLFGYLFHAGVEGALRMATPPGDAITHPRTGTAVELGVRAPRGDPPDE